MIDPARINAIHTESHWINLRPGTFRIQSFQINGATNGARAGFECVTVDGHHLHGVLAAIRIVRVGK